MNIFAPNHVVAESHFWYFWKLCTGQVFKKSPTWVKDFGIWLCYDSHGGTDNTYRQYRDLPLLAMSPSATKTGVSGTLFKYTWSRSRR
ncbi:unnamed protein product [Nyctereutes procyonoides]|uniref:(raccoon dog) hypothetical protein n=1 Tax=Nyctereutes procyonoides TaxID=34880 RepID=A0A811Y2Z5_NYCPR|nr:unnamed protein product [Nyctereutes procyonoides]